MDEKEVTTFEHNEYEKFLHSHSIESIVILYIVKAVKGAFKRLQTTHDNDYNKKKLIAY